MTRSYFAGNVSKQMKFPKDVVRRVVCPAEQLMHVVSLNLIDLA